MAIYVMSDVHGESDRFRKILKYIHFSSDDVLYIIGDVIDRGDDGILLLREIMDQSNMKLILGNHELMFLNATARNASLMEVQSWIWNGGEVTLKAFQMLDRVEKNKIRHFLECCPDHASVTVHDTDCYYLVHGWPGSSTYERCWKHPPCGINSKNPITGKKLIVGHTIILRLHTENSIEQGRCIERMLEKNEHLRISKSSDFIAIDCGCGHFDIPVRRLSCLRLDDGKVFYA